MAVKLPAKAVADKIGGNVKRNFELPSGVFQNACPIRMSYVLNTTGYPIPRSARYAMVSGGDRHQYIYRVGDMMAYLRSTFGRADKTVSSPKPSDFAGLKGILAVEGHGWENARGHITLWDGTKCSDSCHLLGDPENGRFVADTASIWVLQ
jgi:hypothetical protein